MSSPMRATRGRTSGQMSKMMCRVSALRWSPVPPYEGALPRPGQERGAVVHVVCVGHSLDGVQAFEWELA